MTLRTRTLIASSLCVVIAAAVKSSAHARPPVPCTMSFGGSEFPRGKLVGLGTALPESAPAPGGVDVAPETPATGRMIRPPMAQRFLLSDVPREIIEPHRAALKKSSGHVWVVSWFRNSACALESGSLGDIDNKFRHAVLILTPRPWNLWVNGEPTYDAFDGRFGSGTLWEAGPKSENPMSLRDLRVFLAIYPRLAGVTPWREGSFLKWALAHRDSGNTRALRGRLQGLMSERVTDSLNLSPSPLAGIWRGEGVLTGGDSISFWMQLCDGQRRFEWPAAEWGPYPWYEGPARFEKIPMPIQYAIPVQFEATRDSLRCDEDPSRGDLAVPFGASTPTTGGASWAWLARFAPAARQAEFYHNDSLTTAKLRLKSVPPHLTQVISVNAAGNTLTARIKLQAVKDTLDAATVARWTAHRMK